LTGARYGEFSQGNAKAVHCQTWRSMMLRRMMRGDIAAHGF
jgi:hypothetical protein